MLETEEHELDIELRPKALSNFLGQEKIKKNLSVFMQASIIKKETFPHTIFYGHPGLGKTTLATILANEMKSNIIFVNGATVKKTGDMAKYLACIGEGDFLFIDEIHRLRPDVEEMLYTVMEDFRMDIVRQDTSEPIEISISKFTLVGATTRIGNLTKPLRERFKISEMLEDYNLKEMTEICKRTFGIVNEKTFGEEPMKKIKINDDAIKAIARRGRSTPRIANNLTERIFDFAIVEKVEKITEKYVDQKMLDIGIDKNGLKEEDLLVLETLYIDLKNKPSGIENLSLTTTLSKDMIENEIEPFLIKNKLLERTRLGRMVTDKGIEIIKEKNKKVL